MNNIIINGVVFKVFKITRGKNGYLELSIGLKAPDKIHSLPGYWVKDNAETRSLFIHGATYEKLKSPKGRAKTSQKGKTGVKHA